MQGNNPYLQDFERLEQAKAFARVPVSGYRVGAVLISDQGQLFTGANLEFPGQPLSTAVHAEQAAVAAACMAGETDWRELLVSAPPCGHCRQFLREFNDGSLRIRVLGGNRINESTLGELLPQAFGGESFLKDNPSPENSATPAPFLPDNTPWADAAHSALSRSHAPYSGNPAAVVLAGADVQVVGASLESAAFNPSLGPMACALSQWRLAGYDFNSIEQAWLVQNDPSRVNLETQAREILASVTGAPLTVV